MKTTPTVRIDMTGLTFGMWEVLYPVRGENGKAMWWCRCRCGLEKAVKGTHLRRGNSQSCKSCSDRIKGQNQIKAKGYFEETWRSWNHAQQRCCNPNNTSFYKYGARGIKMCQRWAESFENFLCDMGPRPPGKTLDRIDNDGDYEPGNCRWATPVEQANNTRTNKKLTYKGQTKSLTQWSRDLQINRNRLNSRLRLGWSVEDALTIPIQHENWNKSKKNNGNQIGTSNERLCRDEAR